MAQANNYANVWCPAKPQAQYPNYYYIIEVEVKEQSWDASTNKSTLYLEADITGHQIGFEGSDDQYLEVYWYDSKNGEKLGATTTIKKLAQNETKKISGTIQVEHNNNGTLSGKAYTIWGKNGSNTFVPPASGDTVRVEAPLTLTTIPRKSTPSISGTPYIGSSITINTNRKANTFTHTLTYSFGSLSGTIATNVGDSTPWTIPTTFYGQIPNATSGTMTINCTTYSNGTSIGSEAISVRVYVNQSSAKTTLNTPTFTIDSTTNSKTGTTSKYINNYSTISVTCTATNSYNSPIKTISLIGVKSGTETIIETKTYSSTATSQTATFSNKTKLNYDSLRVRATDTRGISSNNASVGITVIAYVPITSDSSPTIVRTTQTGSVAKITSFKGNFWQGSFGSVTNALTIQWRYRVSGGSYSSLYTIPAGSITKSGSTYTISNYTFTNGSTSNLFTYTSLYDIEFTVKDSLQTAPLVTYRLSRGVPNFVIFQNKVQRNGADIITSLATTSANGYMSSTDKSKLNGIANNANNYSLPTASTSTKGGIKVGNNLSISNEVLSMSPTNLYNNTTGSNSSVTLSQSAANFNYLEIFYRIVRGSVSLYYSVKVFSPNGKKIGLFGPTDEYTLMQIGTGVATISGTTITLSLQQMANISSSTAIWNASNFYIVRVDGYK